MRIRHLQPSFWVSVFSAVVGLLFTPSLFAEKPDTSETGFKPMFNGRDLTGWEGNLKLWEVVDGTIVGNSTDLKQNEFLATKAKYADFELRLEFRMKNGIGNSGVQFRSRRLPASHAVEGYQADLGKGYWGCLYDEHRRRKTLVHAPKTLATVLKKSGWNTYIIRAQGSHVTLKINGLATVDYTEPDKKIARTGIIALQLHSGPAMKMEFRKVRIKVFKTK